jgi:hypothetical protein
MRRFASAARAMTSVSQNQPSHSLASTTSPAVARLKNLQPVSVSRTPQSSSTFSMAR